MKKITVEPGLWWVTVWGKHAPITNQLFAITKIEAEEIDLQSLRETADDSPITKTANGWASESKRRIRSVSVANESESHGIAKVSWHETPEGAAQ